MPTVKQVRTALAKVPKAMDNCTINIYDNEISIHTKIKVQRGTNGKRNAKRRR